MTENQAKEMLDVMHALLEEVKVMRALAPEIQALRREIQQQTRVLTR